MKDGGKGSGRQSVLGADKALRVIEGGGGRGGGGSRGGGDGTPTDRTAGASPTGAVVALGHLAGVLHFLDAKGQKRELSARQLGTRHDLLLLFGGDDTWLRENYPKRVNVNAHDAKAEPVWKTVDFHVNDAAAAMQKACVAAGLFGDHIVLRQPGVWPGPDGDPAAHCGDMVLLGEDWRPAGTRTGAQVWAAAAPTRRPAAACPAQIGRDLLQGFRDLWCWAQPGGPVAMMGLLANAYLGAAPQWRPAGFVTGETGAGKSAIQRVMRAALPMHHFDNDTSKAGVEQAVAGRAMAIIIDEAADRANRGASRDLVDLVLSAAGDEGTKGSRGTVDGKGRKIEVVGQITMFSINTPDLEPQHLGRFTVLELRKPEDGADHRVAHADLATFARTHGAALWGRALAGWGRYSAALELFRAGLRAKGCAPRAMDQAGALLAGWWLLTNEGVPDDRGVREGIGAIEGYVQLAKDVAADGRPRRMLQHLLASMVTLNRSTEREPVGELLEIAFGEATSLRPPEEAAKLLSRYGMRVVRACLNAGSAPLLGGCRCSTCLDFRGKPVPRKSAAAGVWFANQHPELRKLFHETPFDGNRWRSEMLRLPGADSSGQTIRIGSAKNRAVWLPRLTMEDADEVDSPDL